MRYVISKNYDNYGHRDSVFWWNEFGTIGGSSNRWKLSSESSDRHLLSHIQAWLVWTFQPINLLYAIFPFHQPILFQFFVKDSNLLVSLAVFGVFHVSRLRLRWGARLSGNDLFFTPNRVNSQICGLKSGLPRIWTGVGGGWWDEDEGRCKTRWFWGSGKGKAGHDDLPLPFFNPINALVGWTKNQIK